MDVLQRNFLEKFLRRVASNRRHLPDLLHALHTSDIIFLGDIHVDADQQSRMQIGVCYYGSEEVIPCFTSRREVYAAKLDQAPFVIGPFTQFIWEARGKDFPVVINTHSPHALMLRADEVVDIPHPALIPAALALRGVRGKPARLESAHVRHTFRSSGICPRCKSLPLPQVKPQRNHR